MVIRKNKNILSVGIYAVLGLSLWIGAVGLVEAAPSNVQATLGTDGTLSSGSIGLGIWDAKTSQMKIVDGSCLSLEQQASIHVQDLGLQNYSIVYFDGNDKCSGYGMNMAGLIYNAPSKKNSLNNGTFDVTTTDFKPSKKIYFDPVMNAEEIVGRLTAGKVQTLNIKDANNLNLLIRFTNNLS